MRAQSEGATDAKDFAGMFTGDTPEAVGKALAHFPVEAFAEAAAAAIPGMTVDAWLQDGDPYVLLELIGFFSKVHDWPFIKEALFGPKDDPEDDRAADLDLQTAVLLLARELGCRIDEPLGFRAEGFFMAAGAVKSRYAAQRDAQERAERQADGWDGPRPADQVVGAVKDPTAAANLARLMAEADARGDAPNG
jgi:hypothetical protein